MLGRNPSFLDERDWDLILTELRLSRRESEIASGIIEGRTEEQLAVMLGISAHTVHTYTDRLYRRLSVKSRSELVAKVFELYVRVTSTPVGKSVSTE